MDIQVQLDLVARLSIAYKTTHDVDFDMPWGSADTVYPLKVVRTDMEPGETKDVYDGILFTLPKDD